MKWVSHLVKARCSECLRKYAKGIITILVVASIFVSRGTFEAEKWYDREGSACIC